MFWMIPLAMAAAGAMMDKKKPLRGALLGGAAGLTGGAALGAGAGGGLLAAEGAAAAPATQAGLLAAQEAGLGSASLGWGGATTGMQGALNGALGAESGAGVGGLLGASQKPAMAALQGAQTAQSMTPEEPQIQPPQLQHVPPDLNGLLQQGMQQQQFDAQENERRKALMMQYANYGRGGM